jgi:hypothetical protein
LTGVVFTCMIRLNSESCSSRVLEISVTQMSLRIFSVKEDLLALLYAAENLVLVVRDEGRGEGFGIIITKALNFVPTSEIGIEHLFRKFTSFSLRFLLKKCFL